ncbi:hypothetical protein [Flavobacterium hungaricum]|uniref:Uncharacterized protein n=1 Tax=Flavobacterium hungaricum TaxID=2082725 RepID=A0ABR9TDV9_9FLAO|nr:hypothetical protein [Flavobacterium hungaricum]MBE8723528.1 hypothetical protein [Flavobacterium hungaricum]
MNILKKIVGVILLLLAVLLCFPAFYAFPIQFERCRKKFEDGFVGAPGGAIALITCFVLYVLITYFLVKFGLKLIRKKKSNYKAIDEIGIKE